jgi:hypothetical protein
MGSDIVDPNAREIDALSPIVPVVVDRPAVVLRDELTERQRHVHPPSNADHGRHPITVWLNATPST